MYRDVKFSTLLDKLNKGIRAALDACGTVMESDYGETVARTGTDLLKSWGYPLRLDYGYYEFSIRTTDKEDGEFGLLVAELEDRFEIISKGRAGERTKRFRRFMKSGPRFEDKVSALIARRKNGVTVRADKAAWEIKKLGYSSPEDFIEAYEAAKKVIDDAFGVWHRYATLSDEEKASVRGRS